MSQGQREHPAETLTLLATGQLEIEGRMPWSSNGTFLASVGEGEEKILAIYKPRQAERPLWDFPEGLYRREVAAYELDRALGWGMVPDTVVRPDGPLGVGSLQRFVAADFEQHYFTLLVEDRLGPALRRMAAFDLVANNADRKGGHCLLGEDGHLWGIDHGLCFHPAPKLRTVMWDFAGEEIPPDVVEDFRRLAAGTLPRALQDLLVDRELEAMLARIEDIVENPLFPEPATDHPYPWPIV